MIIKEAIEISHSMLFQSEIHRTHCINDFFFSLISNEKQKSFFISFRFQRGKNVENKLKKKSLEQVDIKKSTLYADNNNK